MSDDTELPGTLAPPMANGEVLFDAPWQGRVFGMARALAQAGAYDWDEFRARLMDEIAGWDRRHGADPTAEYAYYDHFLRAFERLLADKGLVSADSVGARATAFRARPHGYDHHHHHDHPHDDHSGH
ncbi:MAG: nitrile hydratase accessory protein [Pseudomonadales bacterium]